MTDHQGPPATRFGQNGGICHKQQPRGPRTRSRASCGSSMRLTRCSRLALAALLYACDPQADTGYLGEPLMTLQGHVTSSGPMPSLEAAMLWQRGDPPSTGDQELATRAPVEAAFPARFILRLYQPPPSATRR